MHRPVEPWNRFEIPTEAVNRVASTGMGGQTFNLLCTPDMGRQFYLRDMKMNDGSLQKEALVWGIRTKKLRKGELQGRIAIAEQKERLEKAIEQQNLYPESPERRQAAEKEAVVMQQVKDANEVVKAKYAESDQKRGINLKAREAKRSLLKAREAKRSLKAMIAQIWRRKRPAAYARAAAQAPATPAGAAAQAPATPATS